MGLWQVSKIPASLLNIDVETYYVNSNQILLYKSWVRGATETDAQLRARIRASMGKFDNTLISQPWLDGKHYPQAENTRFGRVSEFYPGWGEKRRQKKSPHTEVMYVFTLSKDSTLVLRSINNCDNNQLTEAIKLAALRLEQRAITQTDAEFILDKCYAELQRRMEWTDRVKESNRRANKSQVHQDNAPVAESDQRK